MLSRLKRGRRTVGIGLAGLGIIAVVALVGLAVLQAPPVRARVLASLISRLERAGIAVRAGRLDYNLLTFNVRLQGVTLATVATPAQPFFTAEEARLVLGWGALQGRMDLARVELVRPRVALRRDGTTANWPVASPPSPSSPAPVVRLRQLRVRDLGVEWRDTTTDSSAEAAAVSIDLVPNAGGAAGALHMTGSTHVRWRDRDVTISGLDGQLSWNSRDLSVSALRVGLPQGALQIDGRVDELMGAPRFDLRLTTDLDLAAIARDMKLKRELPGMLHADAFVKGLASAPEVELTTFAARVAGGSLTGRGRMSIGEGPGVLSLEGRQLNVATLVQAFGGEAAVQPAARLDGSLDASWSAPHLEALRARAEGKTVGSADGLPLDGFIGVDLRDRRWTLRADQSMAGSIRAIADLSGVLEPGDLSRSAMSGAVDVSAPDVGRLAGALARAGVSALPSGIGGAADAHFRVTGTFGAPRLTGSVDAVNVLYEPLGPATLGAHVLATPAEIQLNAIEGRLGESLVRGDARLSIASGTSKGKLGGKLEATLKSADLSPLVPSFPHPQGSVALVVTLSGGTASPRVMATITGADIGALGQQVDALEAGVAITGRTVTVDRLHVQSGDGRLDATGSIDWAQHRFALHAGADHLPIRPVLDAAGAVTVPIATRLTGQIEGEGTFSSLNGHGTLSLADTRWSNADLGPIDARVSAASHTVSVEMRAPDLALTATGDVDVDSRGPVSMHGRWEPTDLATLSRRLGWNPPFPLTGTAALGFDVAGTRDRPRDLRGAVDLDRLSVDVDRQSVRLARPARVEYDGSALRARDVTLTTGQSTFAVTGSLGDPASRGLAIAFDGLLADIASIVRAARPTPFLSERLTEQRSPTGALTIRLDATGPVSHPILSGSLQITDGRLPITAESAVTGIGLAARYDAGVLLVDGLRAAFEGAMVDASGRVPTHLFLDRLPVRWRELVEQTSGPAGGLAGGLAEMNARLTSVTPRVAAPFVDGSSLEQFGGQVDASVQLQADRAALDRLQGTVTLGRAELSLSGVRLDQQKPTRLIFHEGRLDIADWEWGLGDNRVTLSGGMALGGDRNIDVRAGATLDLRLINAFTRAARTSGRADSTVRIGGTVAAPTLDGFVTITGGDLRLASPRIVLSDLTGTITLARDTLTLEQLSSSLNGGPSEIAGTIHHRWLKPLDGKVTLNSHGAALDLYGLRAETDAELALGLGPGGSMVSGTVTLVRSAYREPVSLTGGLLRALQTSSSYVRTGSDLPPGALDNIRLDVDVVTEDDLLVDNNYGRLAVSSNLQIVGMLNQPGLIGRATVSEGGLIYFGGHRYRLVSDGSIDFADPTRIDPDLNLEAVTQVSSADGVVDITLTIKGTPSTLQTSLVSTNRPEIPQSGLVSLLVTGQTAAAGGFAPGSEELLGLLSGELFGAAGRAVGLDIVRIERGSPDVRLDAGLVATETDPGARLTFGKNIGRSAQVVFSQSLRQSGGLTWIVSYAPRSNIELRAVSLDSGTRRYDLRHDLVFGAPGARQPRPPAPEQPRVSTVRIVLHLEPNAALLGTGPDEAALRSRLEIKAGDRFSFFRWQDDRDRLESFYHDRDRLEARVTTRRIASQGSADRAGTVDLTYDVRPGPLTNIATEGFSFRRSVIAAIRNEWTHAIVDDFFAEGAASIARGELIDRGFVQASVVATLDHPAPGEKRLELSVDPGQRTRRQVVVQGNHDIPTNRLRALIGNRDLARAVWLEPDRVRETLLRFYRAQGYLNASVQVDPIAIAGGVATRTIVLQERERFRVRTIAVEGARASSPDEVRTLSALSNADFSEDAIDRARRAINASYRSRGFNNVGITLRTEALADRAEVNVGIKIEEGPEQRLADIVTGGLVRTSPELVSRALQLEVGKPVNLAEWYQARRRLFETAVFRSVDIEPEPMAAPAGDPPQQPIRARVTLEEWPPLRLRYGLVVNDEERTPSAAAAALESASPSGRSFGAGFSGDLSARNLFGHGLSAGVAGGYARDLRAARVYVTSPSMFGRPIVSNVFLSRSREQRGQAADSTSQFVTDTIDLTLEQRVRPFAKMEISYGYSFERNHTFASHPLPGDPLPFDATVNVARLTSTVLLDTRDDLLDATRGSFHSSNLEFGPSSLGSEAQFVKYLFQQRYYYAIRDVVLATSARIGLAAGLHHETLVPSERFFAGGGNSVRGYAQDSLTPRDIFGDAIGGNALLVLNEEVRFPIVKVVRGVGFLDLGHAFATVKDLRLGDLSAGAGIGLRVQTPVVLLRVDYGVPLDSTFGSRRGRLFFSIGQAF